MTRDLTQAQLDKKCKQYGFKPTGFLSYYDVGYGLHVCALNAGTRRRSQLAYLIEERNKAEKRNG